MAAGTHQDPSEVPTRPRKGIDQPNKCCGNTIGCCVCLCCLIILIPVIVVLVIFFAFRDTWDKGVSAVSGVLTHADILNIEEMYQAQEEGIFNLGGFKNAQLSWWTNNFITGALDASCGFVETERIMEQTINSEEMTTTFLDNYIKEEMYCAVSDDLYEDGANCGTCFQIRAGTKSAKIQVISDGASGTSHFDCHDTVFKQITNSEDYANMPIQYQPIPCESENLYAVITDTGEHINVIFAGGKTRINSVTMHVGNDGHETRTMLRKSGSMHWSTPLVQDDGKLSFELVYSDDTIAILDNHCFEVDGISAGSVCIDDSLSYAAVSDSDTSHLAEEDSMEERLDINSNEVSEVDGAEAREEDKDVSALEESKAENSSSEEVVEDDGGLEKHEDWDEDGEDNLEERNEEPTASKDDSKEGAEDEDNSVKKFVQPGELSCCLWEGMGRKCPLWTQNSGFCHESPENCEDCGGRWTSGKGVAEDSF